MQKNISPLISIVIPFYNRTSTLKRCLDSVFSQTYKNIEIILINDGSTDSFKEVLSNYSGIILIEQENLGVSAARNIGISQAKGEWVALLDSDDEWLPKKLEKQIEVLNKNSKVVCIHTEEIWIRNCVRVNQHKKHAKGGGDQFNRSLELCCISPSSVLLKRSLFLNEIGFFREDYPVCEDYDLWLKLTSLYDIEYIQEPLIRKYGGHEDQLSQKYKTMDYYRVKSIDWILQNRELTKDKQEQAIAILLMKTKILINGYKKHDNLKDLAEVQTIMNNYIS